MKHFLIASFITLVLSLCGCASISKRDYKRQSDAELTQRMRAITPPGTSIEDVTSTIRWKLHSGFSRYEMKHYGPLMRTNYGFQSSPDENDVVIRSVLTTYGWAKNFFCAGSLVAGLWLFDEDGRLVEVIVRHGSDGM